METNDPQSETGPTEVAAQRHASQKALALHSSALAKELQKLPDRVRHDLGAPNEVLVALDGAVMLSQQFLDADDPRHWSEKVEAVIDAFAEVGSVYGARISEWLMSLNEEAMHKLVERYGRQGYVAYVRRMVGEAAFHRLRVAATADVDLIGAAAHMGLEGLLPYAVALEDVAGVLTEEQIRAFMSYNPAGGFMIELVFTLLDALDVAVDKVTLPEHLTAMRQARLEAPSLADIAEVTATLRDRISGQSRSLVKDLNDTLDRKLRGARDALAFSADSNSQAANSLIEFIDRLLRKTYTEAEVLAWIEENYPDLADLTYEDRNAGRVRPTKRGQALCFVHARGTVAEPSETHVLVATSLSAIRNTLQQIKHADEGTDEERETITKCLVGLEAFVHLGIGLAWAVVPDAGLEDLKARLDPVRRSSEVQRDLTA